MDVSRISLPLFYYFYFAIKFLLIFCSLSVAKNYFVLILNLYILVDGPYQADPAQEDHPDAH